MTAFICILKVCTAQNSAKPLIKVKSSVSHEVAVAYVPTALWQQGQQLFIIYILTRWSLKTKSQIEKFVLCSSKDNDESWQIWHILNVKITDETLWECKVKCPGWKVNINTCALISSRCAFFRKEFIIGRAVYKLSDLALKLYHQTWNQLKLYFIKHKLLVGLCHSTEVMPTAGPWQSWDFISVIGLVIIIQHYNFQCDNY